MNDDNLSGEDDNFLDDSPVGMELGRTHLSTSTLRERIVSVERGGIIGDLMQDSKVQN